MKEAEDDPVNVEHPDEGMGLRLVHPEKRESLRLDPELKTLIDKMKSKPKRVKLKFDDGPEEA